MPVAEYRFDTEIVASDAAQFKSYVSRAHSRRERPYCMCIGGETGVEVYVARAHEKYQLKRMPNTGPNHAPHCDHYEPADDLTGLGQLRGQAIIDDAETGETLLKLGFPMSRGPSRLATASSVEDKPSIKSDGTKLTLRGILHYLWNEAQLTHWHPKMRGKRNWHIVRQELLGAAELKVTKGQHLSEMLYVPERFSLEHKFEIARRRREKTARANASTKQLSMIIGEIKSFEASSYGEKLVIKHLPDWPLFMDEVLAKRCHKNFEREIEQARANADNHLILCATFDMSKADYPHIREMTVMLTNNYWLPFETVDERDLVEQCVAESRHFIKGMRMNLAADKPIASVILTDTQPMSTALYLAKDHVSAEYTAILEERMTYAGSAHHVIRPGDPLPATTRR